MLAYATGAGVNWYNLCDGNMAGAIKTVNVCKLDSEISH